MKFLGMLYGIIFSFEDYEDIYLLNWILKILLLIIEYRFIYVCLIDCLLCYVEIFKIEKLIMIKFCNIFLWI